VSEEDEQAEATQSNLPLLLRELLAAAIGLGLFCGLIFGPGKLGAPEQWNASTVALLADAATVSSVVTVPLALLFGGSDLIALIVRIVARALKDRERRSLELRLKLPRAALVPNVRRRAAVSRRPRRVIGWPAIVAAAALVAVMIWFVPIVLRSVSVWWSQPIAASSSDSRDSVSDQPTVAQRSTPDLPSYCGLEPDGPVCAANELAPSPEALGRAVCNRGGLGWPIYWANREERGYAFDPYHVPPGTRFTVRCP